METKVATESRERVGRVWCVSVALVMPGCCGTGAAALMIFRKEKPQGRAQTSFWLGSCRRYQSIFA
jgi:hypothetical protein